MTASPSSGSGCATSLSKQPDLFTMLQFDIYLVLLQIINKVVLPVDQVKRREHHYLDDGTV